MSTASGTATAERRIEAARNFARCFARWLVARGEEIAAGHAGDEDKANEASDRCGEAVFDVIAARVGAVHEVRRKIEVLKYVLSEGATSRGEIGLLVASIETDLAGMDDALGD